MKRENAVNVKLSERELKMLDELCESMDLSRSETIRIIIRIRHDETFHNMAVW